jgi:hypothetical protein
MSSTGLFLLSFDETDMPGRTDDVCRSAGGCSATGSAGCGAACCSVAAGASGSAAGCSVLPLPSFAVMFPPIIGGEEFAASSPARVL